MKTLESDITKLKTIIYYPYGLVQVSSLLNVYKVEISTPQVILEALSFIYIRRERERERLTYCT